jgi:molecular chaperone HscA
MAKIGINLTTGSLQKEEMIVGIDLGTTNSLIAIIHPDTKLPVVLKEHDATALVPSLIHFGAGQALSIGHEAKKYLVSEPENTIFSVKRLMGKSYKDVSQTMQHVGYKIFDDGTDNLVKIEVNGRFYTPVELSSFILKALKLRAEHILKTPVNKAVITVPAYFNDAQRQATRDAGKLAGLDVLRIVNEPTAASLAYGVGLKKGADKTVAVYDLGGGTFDISILWIADGIFEVLSTNGDTYLGGDDFDNAIVQYWLKELKLPGSPTPEGKSFMQELRLKAEEAKIYLSANTAFSSYVQDKKVELTRELFQDLIAPYVSRTIQHCIDALKDAGMPKEAIDEVIMVGGATRVPLVQEQVAAFFGKRLHTDLNPDEVVALGAAIQADILAGNNKELLLLDITPLSLGIETMGGLMDVLLPRNSKIPTRAARQYTTQKDGQSGLIISVYQGERDLVQDNRKLAEFTLSGIPAMPAGLPKIEISFLIDADGILIVRAKELRSNIEQQIEVKPQYGLTDDEVERLLMDSIHHARDDMERRALVEAQTEAKILSETTKNFVNRNKDLLSVDEKNTTNSLLEELEIKLVNGSKDEIQQTIEILNSFSKTYAERLMDEAVKKLLEGKKI